MNEFHDREDGVCALNVQTEQALACDPLQQVLIVLTIEMDSVAPKIAIEQGRFSDFNHSLQILTKRPEAPPRGQQDFSQNGQLSGNKHHHLAGKTLQRTPHTPARLRTTSKEKKESRSTSRSPKALSLYLTNLNSASA